MKILSIRFRNLNSLEGEWDINLQDPAFTSSGIFAITGPTGSGKTTILDAICLALYGQTPRLEKISGSTNEIMTRHTAECYAEVTFESSRGVFRCNWRQKRARGRPEGKLQQPEHEIIDGTTHRVLENKIREVSARVRDATGMDFDQFTRSVLLAQGGFSAFLEAKPDERAPILEQITGTGIYSRISRKVHERTGEERERLRILQEQAGAIQVLNDDEEKSLIAQKEGHEVSAAELGNRVRILQEQLDLLNRVEGLKRDIARLQEELGTLAEKRHIASGELRRLEKGRKAALFGPDWKTLSGLEKKEKEDQDQLVGLHRTEETAKAGCIAAESDLLTIDTYCRRLQQDIEEQRPVIIRVRELDEKINLLRAESDRLTRDIESLEKKKVESASDLHTLREQQEQYGAEREQAAAYLNEHKDDRLFIEAYSGLHARIETCIEYKKNVIQIIEALHRTSESLEKVRSEHEEKKKILIDHQAELDRIQKKIACHENRLSTIFSGLSISGIRERQSELKIVTERLKSLLEVALSDRKSRERLISLIEQADFLASSLLEQESRREELSRQYKRQEDLVAALENNLHLAARVRDLEVERARLVPGEPCPLCGSTDHPFATGELPDPDISSSLLETEKRTLKEIQNSISRISIVIGTISSDISKNQEDQKAGAGEIEEAEKEWISGAELPGVSINAGDRPGEITAVMAGVQEELAQISDLISRYETCEKELQAEKEKHSLEKDLHNLLSKEERETEFGYISLLREYSRQTDEKITISGKITAEHVSLKEILSRLDISDPDPETLILLDSDIKNRRDQFQKNDTLYLNLGKRVENIIVKIDSEQKRLNELIAEITGKSDEFRRIQSELMVYKQDRVKIFGEKDPGLEEDRMSLALREAEQKREDLRRVSEEKQREYSTLTGTIQSCTITLKALHDDIQEKMTRFLSDIRLHFGDITTFRECLLSPDELTRLESISADLTREETTLSALLKDKLDTVRDEEIKVQNRDPPDLLQNACQDAKKRLEIIQDEIAVTRHRLEENQARKDQFSGRIEEAERQRKELIIWERLHSLIGSADGKKFRVFAQGLTFQLLIIHANRHLQQMTDRYILLPDRDTPLDLAVIDTWQAGEIRSVRNLSGGESFIVSLALALGLSGMASKNVRVDSLFLDEGFGTLDDDALDTALGALSGLNQQGKLIGIISHVPAIRERISTQIRIEKRSNGRSIISAPGCRKI